MTHINVDLETLGLTPGSVIRSIGAVVFDPITGRMGSTFYRNITRESCEAAGLTVNPETEAWWAKPENAEAQAHLEADQVPLADALGQFAVWWTSVGGEEFWANDPNFDETLLVAAYAAVGLPHPWHYRAPRSCRTIYALAGVAPNRDAGVHHNALVDAKNQAVAVHDAYVKLGLATRPGCYGAGGPVAHAGRVLQDNAHGASSSAGWWFHKPTGLDLVQVVRNPTDPLQALLAAALVAQKLCLSHSELSEAMEGHRKGLMDDHLPHRPMIEVELADAVIRIADLAGALNLDLGGAIAEKMAYNAVRPDHKAEVRETLGGKAY